MRKLLLLSSAVLFATGIYALAQVSQPTVNTVPAVNQTWLQAGIESRLKTYKYSSLTNTPAATTTDGLTITGSATKTIRVAKIIVGGLATGAGQMTVQVNRNVGGVDTGGTGTSQAAAIASRDTNNSAATALITLYTANPTIAAGALVLDSCRLFFQTAAGGAPDVCAFTYGINDDQMTVLRGVTDQLAINFNSSAVPSGGKVDYDIEWVEEP